LFGNPALRQNRFDDNESPSSSIDIEELDADVISSSSITFQAHKQIRKSFVNPFCYIDSMRGISGLGSAFQQVKPLQGSQRRSMTDSDGSPASTSSDNKKEKHVWRPY